MEVTAMYPQIKNLFIILCILCFLAGCTQVKHIVGDVKEVFSGEKEDTPKAPAESTDTKTAPASTKKGTKKTTQPPVGEVFGPR